MKFPLEAPQPTRLWLYYKPLGLVTSESDEKGRQTIYDALPRDLPGRPFPESSLAAGDAMSAALFARATPKQRDHLQRVAAALREQTRALRLGERQPRAQAVRCGVWVADRRQDVGADA